MSNQARSNGQIYQKLIEYMENTKDFVLGQVSEVIQQAFKYEKISTYLSICLMAVLLCSAIGIKYCFWKYPILDKYGSREFASFFDMVIPGIIAPLFFVQLCYFVDKLVKIHIAPKYYLINLITSLKN